MSTYNSVKTIWGIALEASRRPGNVFTPIAYSTLNEYFSVEANAELPANSQPEVQYFAIGRGGHKNVVGGSGESLSDNLQHRIDNACLFEHLPHIMRPVDDDLSAVERGRFRMRKMVSYDGISYFAYYLRKIEFVQAESVIVQTTISNGNVTVGSYVPSINQLNPQAVSMENGVVNTATGEHLGSATPFVIELTTEDIAEIMSCVSIIYGDDRYGVISEMGIVSGIDSIVTSTLGGSTVTYTEALAAQVFNFIGTDFSLSAQSSGQTFNYSLGSTLPWLK